VRLVANAGSVLYPVVVFVALPQAPAVYAVALALLLAGLRVCVIRNDAQRKLALVGLLVVGMALAVLLGLDPPLAAKAYPTLVSIAVAGLFAASLMWPPTLIERIARRSTAHLPPAAIIYTRTLTWIWTLFLLLNAAIAAALALWASLALWTLWTGLVSYLLMACLLCGEWIVRRHVLRRSAPEGAI